MGNTCLEAELIYLDYESSRLTQELDRLCRVFDARELKVESTGLEAYELSCLTGCNQVYPIDPYGQLNGVTWTAGLNKLSKVRAGLEADEKNEEGNASATPTISSSGDSKGFFSRFFGFIGRCFSKIGDFLFGTGNKEGKATEAIMKAVAGLQEKAKTIQEIIRNNRDKYIHIKFNGTGGKCFDLAWIKHDLKDSDVAGNIARLVSTYPTDDILTYIAETVNHISKAAGEITSNDKYEAASREEFASIKARVDAARKVSDDSPLSELGLTWYDKNDKHQVPYAKMKNKITGAKYYSDSDSILAINGEQKCDFSEFIENPSVYIKLDKLVEWRDKVKQYGGTLGKAKGILNKTSKDLKQNTDDRIRGIRNDIKQCNSLILSVGKFFGAQIKLLQKIIRGLNALLSHGEKMIREGIKIANAEKDAENESKKASNKASNKTAMWTPNRVIRGL